METQTIGSMTLAELQALVSTLIDERLQALGKPAKTRSLDEVFASVNRNRWTPPPGSPSTLELLREDRSGQID